MAVGVPGKSESLQRVGESGIFTGDGTTTSEGRWRTQDEINHATIHNSTSIPRIGYQIIGVHILGLFIILL